jgi:hypothetical protein
MIESEPWDSFNRFCHEHVSGAYLVAQYKMSVDVPRELTSLYESWASSCRLSRRVAKIYDAHF